MKLLFIEAKKKIKLENKAILDGLPDNLTLLYTMQYKPLAEQIKNYLKKKKILKFSQFLGCSKINVKSPVLLVSSGKFHALALAKQTDKEIFIFNNNRIEKLSNPIEKKEKAKIAKFLYSDNIGLLFSCKLGQSKLICANKLKAGLEKKFKGKNFYFFVSDTINVKELENFPIDMFINFSCPGLAFDSSKILNFRNINF